MNHSTPIRQLVIIAALAVFALMAGPAMGAESANQRYIVILKSRSGPAPDLARLGGAITFRQNDELIVTLPLTALASLKADPLVRYIQNLAGSDAPAILAGEPAEPTAGAPRRFVPHAMAGNLSWSRQYAYDDAGNIINIGSQQFVYDSLGRLTEMATGGSSTESYAYDRYGNQTSRVTSGATQTMPVDTATNRLTIAGYGYDAAGNVTSGDSYTFTYDALGQTATKTYTASGNVVFSETYIYTASDERIGVQTSVSDNSSGNWLYWSVRDEGGEVLRQYRSSATDPTQAALWIEDYVYRDGQLVGAERPATLGGRHHVHLDHLGSPRLITSDTGLIVSTHDYLPFGGETSSVWQETGAGFDREDPMKFTGHERDYAGSFGREDGHAIDYMHARYYSAFRGRFASVDPIPAADAPLKPQHWNRYVYSFDSPLGYADPTGRTVYNQLNSEDSAMLLDELRSKTGLDLYYDGDNKLQSHGQMYDANGKALGSATAAAGILSAIAPGSTHILQSDSHVWLAQNTGAVTKMNFADIRQINTGRNPSATLDAASIVIHEMIGHGSKGLFDFPGQQTNNQSFLLGHPNWKGPVVDYDNKIRRELGLPERSQYQTKQDNQNKTYIPFQNGPVYLPAEHQ